VSGGLQIFNFLQVARLPHATLWTALVIWCLSQFETVDGREQAVEGLRDRTWPPPDGVYWGM